MNRFNLFLARLLVLLFLAVGIGTVLAPDAEAVKFCSNYDQDWAILAGGDISNGSEITSGLDSISFQVEIGSEYIGKTVELRWNKNIQVGGPTLTSAVVNQQGRVNFTIDDQDFLTRGTGHGGRKIDINVNNSNWCQLTEIFLIRDIACTSAQVIQDSNINPSCIDTQTPVTLRWTVETGDGPYEGDMGVESGGYTSVTNTPNFTNGVGEIEIPTTKLRMLVGETINVQLRYPQSLMIIPGCDLSVPITQINKCSEEDLEPPPGSLSSETFKLCNQIPASSPARAQCIACTGEEGKEKVWTAVGCISKNPEDIIGTIVEIGIGLAGGIALLMIVAGGFMLTISQGDPQRTNQAKEMITSAIIGLLFVLFSVVILQFIGVTVFQIPGFGTEATVQ